MCTREMVVLTVLIVVLGFVFAVGIPECASCDKEKDIAMRTKQVVIWAPADVVKNCSVICNPKMEQSPQEIHDALYQKMTQQK